MIPLDVFDSGWVKMAAIHIRNIPEDIHLGLKALAVSHGRSTEAEVRDILEAAVKPETRIRMGEALWNLGRKAGLTHEEVTAIESARDRTQAEPMSFDE
jgi:antitoxin FitA